MTKEDFERIAKEFGEDTPKQETKQPPKEEKLSIEDKQPTVKKEVKSITHIRLVNGFSFGLTAAIGFWLVTLIIAGAVYLVLTFSGLF